MRSLRLPGFNRRLCHIHVIEGWFTPEQSIEVVADGFKSARLGFFRERADVRRENHGINAFKGASRGWFGFANIEGCAGEPSTLESREQGRLVHYSAAGRIDQEC